MPEENNKTWKYDIKEAIISEWMNFAYWSQEIFPRKDEWSLLKFVLEAE